MYISPKASRIRQREAQRARDNRAEIVKARALGQVTRRDLIRWGIFTAGGVAGLQERSEPLGAQRLCRRVPTGHAAQPPVRWPEVLPSASTASTCSTPVPITPYTRGSETDAVFGGAYGSEPYARRLSYHTDFSTRRPGTTKQTSQIRSPTGARWKAARRERSLPISAGTSSSPRSATSSPCAQVAAQQASSRQGIAPFLTPNSRLDLCHGPLRLQHALGDHAAAPVQGSLRRAHHYPHL